MPRRVPEMRRALPPPRLRHGEGPAKYSFPALSREPRNTRDSPPASVRPGHQCPAYLKPATQPAVRLSLRSTLCADRSPLLETFAAIYRTPLCGLERNGCFFSALRAYRLRFDALRAVRTRFGASLRARGLAALAPLGLVLKALIGEKHLFAGGEDKLSPAFRTLQDLIVVFHALLRNLAGRGQAAIQATSEVMTRSDFCGFPH
jgi:hypothetical protein